ncbi:DUF4625 domain-containing protein [Echinicola salinicaeni]|uniref:DUF4625 domain-containing protein n=1 Tax=Echinicola salinicaeni TaxID=2762757 RepID=UPI001648EC81|nr:DUF4625 domain-containing protein [Echinicola salinicaeni]
MKYINHNGIFSTCLLSIFVFLIASCQISEDEQDLISPEIDNSFLGAFPRQCAVIKRGETFVFRAVFKDKVELGSYSLDVHHNFDHHSHSTEVNDCNMDPVKTAENPFLLIESLPIPEGLKTYEAIMEITVPEDVDPGDYHFMIKVTDKEGWQTLKGISIKLD